LYDNLEEYKKLDEDKAEKRKDFSTKVPPDFV
jgi:hypothetical protein